MLTFIQQLKSRYQQDLQNLPKNSADREKITNKLSAIRLAHASLLKLELNQTFPDHPLQISILGPTQSGKSTLLNFLTNSNSAGVSALAGYTVHAHAFAIDMDIDNVEWAERIFIGFEAVQAAKLDPKNFHQYTIELCKSKKLKKLAPCVLWDTPDFDSVESYGYRSAVLHTLALSDLIILVLSREKYADKSVWDLIELATPLNKPMLVCINKLDSSSADAVPESFRQRYSQYNSKHTIPTVISIPFVKNLDTHASGLTEQIRKKIINELKRLAKKIDRKQQKASTYDFIQHYWQPLTGPVIAEHAATKKWQNLINGTLEGAESQFKRDYLNHPENYDTFKKTLAQLLMLLEIPGIAQPLVKVRRVITWPMRRILKLGSSYISSSEQTTKETNETMEQTVLNNTCNNALISLITQIDQQQESSKELKQWWQTLGQTLFENKDRLASEFDNNISIYQAGFQLQIENAAEVLYQNLEQQPKTLNSLRAARATADAAAVVLALKTGGIGINDLLLAPAMLSVTSMLTESALGRYLNLVKAKLRVEQLESVKNQLYEGYLKQALLDLGKQNSNNDDVFISENSLSAAAESLRKSRAK